MKRFFVGGGGGGSGQSGGGGGHMRTKGASLLGGSGNIRVLLSWGLFKNMLRIIQFATS